MNYKIGLEATALLSSRLSGIQRYILELSNALMKLSYPASDTRFELCLKGTRIKKAYLRPTTSMDHRWYLPFPGFSCKRYSLVHALDTILPSPLPPRIACTIHDLFSIVIKDYSKPRFRRHKIRSYQRIIKHCNAIIVPSNTTKRDLLNNFKYPEERIFVIPHGVSPRFFRQPSSEPSNKIEQLTRPYILAFGGRERKNFPRVVQAFVLSKLNKDYDLVVIGGIDRGIQDVVQDDELGQSIRIMNNVSDEHLPTLYHKASLLCFPSLYEGFGLPVLEAMASSTPVLTSNVGGVADIGLGHATLVDPLSVAGIATGMHEALAVSKEGLEQARLYAKKFTWEKAALATKNVYKYILHSE